MTRIALLLAGLLLMIAACGDDDAATTEPTAAETTTTTAVATTTTAAMTTTTEADTTTTAAPTSDADAFIAMAADMVGDYNGQWTNSTFGSTGPLFIGVVEANTEAGFVLIQVDADGNAFGGADPDLFAVEIFVDGDTLQMGTTEFLGAATFEIDESGVFTVVANPPALGGNVLEVQGRLTADGFSGDYNIPDLATGSFEVFAEM